MKITDKIILMIPIVGLIYRYNKLYQFSLPIWWDVYQLLACPYILGWLFLKFIGYNIYG